MMGISTASRLQSSEEYYFSKKLKELEERRNRGQEIINLGIGSPDLPPPKAAIDRMVTEAQKPESHGYQSYRGLPALREGICDWYRRSFDVHLTSSEVLPLMGSKEGLMHLAMTYLDSESAALIPNPGYPTYEAVTKLAEAEAIYYPLSSEHAWLPQLKDLDSLVKDRNVKIMWMNYTHMPTGTRAPLSFFKDLLTWSVEHQILLVNDNPYAFILSDQPVSALQATTDKAAHPNLIELNSLSKSFNMAGWRLGCMLAKEEHISQVLRFKSNMDSGMFLPLQWGAVEALQSESAWYDSINQAYRRRRDKAVALLEQLGCTVSGEQEGMFVWAKVPDTWDKAVDLTEKVLNETGVFITPGFIFGSQGEKYVRISLCSPEAVLQRAMDKLSAVAW